MIWKSSEIQKYGKVQKYKIWSVNMSENTIELVELG